MQVITSNETELLASLRAGEGEAFRALMRAHVPALLGTAQRLLRSEDEALDAVYEAFLSFFKSIAAFDSNAQLATCLHRIVINVCLAKLRAERQSEEDIEHLLPRFDHDGRHAEPIAAWSESAGTVLQSPDLPKIVRSSIDALPDRYRLVLLLRDTEGIGTEEVAKLLDETPATVRVRLLRARQALRALLDAHMRL